MKSVGTAGRVDTVFQEMVVLEEETKILYVDEQADIAVFQILTPQKVESGSKKHRKSSGARVVRLIAGDHHSRQSWVNALTENIPVNLDIWAVGCRTSPNVFPCPILLSAKSLQKAGQVTVEHLAGFFAVCFLL